MSKSPITPTLGRIVWVRINGEDYAGIITKPNVGPDHIEAAVFGLPGSLTMQAVSNVILAYDDMSDDSIAASNYSWRWMPYQLEQAAKPTEPEISKWDRGVAQDRTERPDFGVLGSIGETLAQAGLDPAEPPQEAVGYDSALPSSPALCATLDEVRRYAEAQTGDRYNPPADARVALGLIKALAGIIERQGQDKPSPTEEAREVDYIDRNVRMEALAHATSLGLHRAKEVVEAAEDYRTFLLGQPSGKVYATKADADRLHSRIDDLAAEMQRAVSGA